MKRLCQATTTLLLDSNKNGFVNNDDPKFGISLQGSCQIQAEGFGTFPIDFHLTNLVNNGTYFLTVSDHMSLDVVVSMVSEAEPESEDEDGEMYYSWSPYLGEWDFCVVKIHFCSIDNKVVFTKCLHIDHDIEDCGCDPLYPNKTCEASDMDNLQHNGKVSVNYSSIFSVEEMKTLLRQHLFKCGLEILVKIEVILAANDTMYTQCKLDEVLLVDPRKMRNFIDNQDIRFKIGKSGEIIQAHQQVVKAGSELLKIVLDSNSEEVKKGEILIAAEWVTKELFDDFLDGLYGFWNIDDMDKNQNNLPLLLRRLKLCHFYKCRRLFVHVLGILVGRPNSSYNLKSALHLYQIGCQYESTCLKYRSLQWIESERKSSRGLLTLTPEQKKEINEFLKAIHESSDRRPLIITAGLQVQVHTTKLNQYSDEY